MMLPPAPIDLARLTLPGSPLLPGEIRRARESDTPPPFDWDTRDTTPAPPPDLFEDDETP